MLAFGVKPLEIERTEARAAETAYTALAGAARHYLQELEHLASTDPFMGRGAMITRVRGTGPGVAFGSLLQPILATITRPWQCPFEGSQNVSGAELKGTDILRDPLRTDGFLVLHFAPHTLDLPLHIHPHSDRFIFAIEGRGFFHLASIDDRNTQPRTIAVRDRDALMFRRGATHTFSTAGHGLTLLSYHQPFIDLDDPRQYVVPQPPRMPAAFLQQMEARVSFDAGWTCLM